VTVYRTNTIGTGIGDDPIRPELEPPVGGSFYHQADGTTVVVTDDSPPVGATKITQSRDLAGDELTTDRTVVTRLMSAIEAAVRIR